MPSLNDPLYAPVIAWVGLALLLLVCLPFARISRLVLEVCALVLRLALLAAIAAAAYLWFRPGDLPVEVAETLDTLPPSLQPFLPEPGTQHFGVCMVSLIVLLFLPLLAVFDVSRKLAGWRLRRLRTLAEEEPKAEEPKVVEPPPPPPAPAPVVRRIDRRAAAATLAEAGSRPPAPNRPSASS
jgi:hypothetical protein